MTSRRSAQSQEIFSGIPTCSTVWVLARASPTNRHITTDPHVREIPEIEGVEEARGEDEGKVDILVRAQAIGAHLGTNSPYGNRGNR